MSEINKAAALVETVLPALPDASEEWVTAEIRRSQTDRFGVVRIEHERAGVRLTSTERSEHDDIHSVLEPYGLEPSSVLRDDEGISIHIWEAEG